MVATTDAQGAFRVPGICASSRANVSAQMDGFSMGATQAQANSSVSAVVTVILHQLGRDTLGDVRQETVVGVRAGP